MQQPHGGPFYGTGNFLPTLPNVDGFVIAKPLRQLFAEGNFEPRPLIVGANRDEGTIFHSSLFALEVVDEAEYREAIVRRFGQANVDAIVARYPVASYASANRALAEVTGDAFFVCSARRTARGATAAGAPVYAYSFQRELTNTFMQNLGVFHITEVPFVFGTDGAFPLGRVGDAGMPLADTTQAYWTRFAASGDPNGGGDPEWPTSTGDRHLVLDATVTAGTAYKAGVCDFWDGITVP
jgi:para-nitrobenzyl esterase